MIIFFAVECSYYAVYRVKFSNFFFEFFAKCPRLTNTVKGCKKVVSFYSGKLSNVLFNEKNASAALSGLVTPEDFDLSSGIITALTGT